jgi:CTP synthase (UTP-ammonia lyase)
MKKRTPNTKMPDVSGGGVRLDMQHLAGEHGMSVAGRDDTGEVRAIERPDHPFFVGTLYQPQLSSTPGRPHPLFVALLRATAH